MKLTKNPKVLYLVLTLLILVILSPIFLRVYKSLSLKDSQLQEKIDKNSKELGNVPTLSSTQANLNSEIFQLDKKLSQLEDAFFTRTEEVFANINRYATETRVSIKAIEPLERTRIETPGRENRNLELLPINLKIKCDFFQLMRFLKKIEYSKNLMHVVDIKIQSDSRDIWNHDIQISLKIPILVS